MRHTVFNVDYLSVFESRTFMIFASLMSNSCSIVWRLAPNCCRSDNNAIRNVQTIRFLDSSCSYPGSQTVSVEGEGGDGRPNG